MASLKDIHPLKIYQHTKYYGPTLTGATFAPTSDVWASAILEWFNYNCLLLEGHQQTNETEYRIREYEDMAVSTFLSV
jgi:hypothetical protein